MANKIERTRPWTEEQDAWAWRELDEDREPRADLVGPFRRYEQDVVDDGDMFYVDEVAPFYLKGSE